MKYGEKYKTAEERIIAFEKYHEEGCSHCETCPSQNVRCFGSKTAKGYLCYQSWLDLEAESEKPMDCPFCGSECIVEETVPSGYYYCQCISGKHCNYGSGRVETRDDAIDAHNRLCKAVAAYNKKGV